MSLNCLAFRCSVLAGLLLVSASRADELADRLVPLLSRHEGKVAVYVRHLDSGVEFAHDADTVMPTASLIKLPVMVAAYRMVDAGTLDLTRMITMREEDKVPGSGILTTHFTAGAQLSVRDAIRLMIAFSDNTATNLVVDQIGLKTTADTMEELGYPDTKLHAKVFRGDTSIFPARSREFGLGSTTPRQICRLLEQIHRQQVASANSCAAMMQHLFACDDKQKIIRGLPAGTKFAHKTGSVNAVRTDAGIIVSPQGPIVVCVMTRENSDTRWTPDNAAEVLCGRIGSAVYDFFNPANSAAPDAVAAEPTVLTVGAMGKMVEALQRTLNERLTPSPDLSVDGDFGPVTKAAVVRFQQAHQLTANGDVGPETWRALGPLLTDAAPVPAPEEVNSEQLSSEPRENLDAPPLVTAKAWAIADARTGVLLWGNNERERLHFASTTKVMTAYLVLKLAEQDPSVLDELVTFSQRADNTGGSTAELRAGEQLPVRELLYGLMLPSGNDASVALAEHFGSRFVSQRQSNPPQVLDPLELFVAEMNRTAVELGMDDTQYRNPHGLTHAEHQSTAADLIVLAQAARQLPLFRHYVGTRQHGYTVASTAGYTRNVVWKNTNRLLSREGYDGVKTGTTDAAGACLISAGHRGDDELVIVVLGSANSEARYIDTRNLFRWSWRMRE